MGLLDLLRSRRCDAVLTALQRLRALIEDQAADDKARAAAAPEIEELMTECGVHLEDVERAHLLTRLVRAFDGLDDVDELRAAEREAFRAGRRVGYVPLDDPKRPAHREECERLERRWRAAHTRLRFAEQSVLQGRLRGRAELEALWQRLGDDSDHPRNRQRERRDLEGLQAEVRVMELRRQHLDAKLAMLEGEGKGNKESEALAVLVAELSRAQGILRGLGGERLLR